MSKLKRKKSVVEEARSEQKLRIEDRIDSLHARDCGPWWIASDLTELETLWARALQALCPTFSDATAVCPELPQPCMESRRSERSERPWWSLGEEASVLPEALAPSTRSLPLLPPFAPSPGPEQPDGAGTEQQSAVPLRHLHADQRKCASLLKCTEKPGLSREMSKDNECSLGGNIDGGPIGNSGKSRGLECRVGIKDLQSSGSHNNRGPSSGFAHWQSGKTGKESGRIIGSGIGVSGPKRELSPKTGLSDSECRTSGVSRMESRCGVGSGWGEGSASRGSGLETDSTAGRSGGDTGLGGHALECCPMCLMPFPKGFPQMECDGHLAKCLSEMNADIVW